MAVGKNSFILYKDILHTVNILTNEQAGKLFRTILEYVSDQDPEPDDLAVKIAFEPIKQSLKRDLKRWDKYIEKQSINGKKGGRPPETQKTQAFSDKPKKADSVSVSVSVSDSKRERAFCPPTRSELVTEMQKKLDDFTAEGEADKFLDFYTSKGWMVGKTKMKDWKAAVRNWIRGMSDFTKKPNFNQNIQNGKLGTSEARIQRASEW